MTAAELDDGAREELGSIPQCCCILPHHLDRGKMHLVLLCEGFVKSTRVVGAQRVECKLVTGTTIPLRTHGTVHVRTYVRTYVHVRTWYAPTVRGTYHTLVRRTYVLRTYVRTRVRTYYVGTCMCTYTCSVHVYYVRTYICHNFLIGKGHTCAQRRTMCVLRTYRQGNGQAQREQF